MRSNDDSEVLKELVVEERDVSVNVSECSELKDHMETVDCPKTDQSSDDMHEPDSETKMDMSINVRNGQDR